MANIITYLEFASFRNISQKLDEGKITECIGLAQQSDLLQILGDFYFDVIANLETEAWQPLFNGGAFEYNGETFEHAGVKKLLADYTYSRYVYMVNINPTPFGFQTKFTNDSEGIDRNTIKDLAKQAQVDAGIKFSIIQKYLLSEPVLFSRYCKSQNKGTSFFTTRFSKL